VVAVEEKEGDLRVKDEVWMGKVVQRDERAIQVLYGRYAPLLHHVAVKSLDEGAAEDLVQEVFFVVWTKSRDFDPTRGSFRNWILQIAHFRILNELRRRSRRPALDFEDMDVLVEAMGNRGDPSEETWKSFRVNALQEAIERLPGAQRQALRLAFFDELSHEEVAETLGLPLGTVKGRIRLALRKLKRGLVPVAFGLLVAWGAGASAWALLSINTIAAKEGSLAFVTRADVAVKKLAAVDGSVTGTCSYDTQGQTVALGLAGLKELKAGETYRLWARWGGDWTEVGDIEWEGEGRGFLRAMDAHWSEEPRAIEVTVESARAGTGPAGPIIVGTEL